MIARENMFGSNRHISERLIRVLVLTLVSFFGFLMVSCQSISPLSSQIVYSKALQIEDPALRHVQDQSDLTYREGWFQDGDYQLHFVEAGDGPLIILYHGFPSYWLSWRDQIEILAKTHRVVAVDGLGAGLSSKPIAPEPYEIERLAGQLDRLADALAPNERFILIGHDWGSALSLSYAQAYPNRLHGVIGMSAPPLNVLLGILSKSEEQQAGSDYMQRFSSLSFETIRDQKLYDNVAVSSYAKLERDGALSAQEIAFFHDSVGRAEAVHAGMNWYRANIPPWDEVAPNDQWPGPDMRLQIPSLFVWGEDDGVFLPETIDAVLDVEPNLQVAYLPGVGHWTSMDQPELANQAILAFIYGLESSP